VKELLATYDDHDWVDLLEAYQRARRHGEIYEYPSEDGDIVKITEEEIGQ